MRTFLLTLFAFLAIVALASANNAAIFVKFLSRPIKGKYGQLNTNIKRHLFDGVHINPKEAKKYYVELKHSIGSPIGQQKNTEIAHALVFTKQVLKKTAKPIKKHSSQVLKKVIPKIIADMQTQEAAILKAVWVSFDKSAKDVLGKKYTAYNQAKFRANIKKVIKFWVKIQVKSFCKVHCAVLPPYLQKQLN
jgi:hypothetical protein